MRRDEAIRRKIDQEYGRKKRTPTKPQIPRQGTPGSVAALKPSEAVTCKGSTTIYEVSQLMLAKRSNCILVLGKTEQLIGLFTPKDLAFRVVGRGLDAATTSVEQVMTPNPSVSSPNRPASEALDEMLQQKYRHMPVVEEGQADILGALDIVSFYRRQMRKFDRLNDNFKKLYDSLDAVQNELGASSHPSYVGGYLESLQTQIGGPLIGAVLESMAPPVFASLKSTVHDIATLMRMNNTSIVLIRDGTGKLVGVVSSKDVTFRAVAAGLNPRMCSVVRIMTPNPDIVDSSTSIQLALKQMLDGGYLNLPVRDESGSVLGIVGILSLIQYMVQATTQQQGEDAQWTNFWTTIEDELDSGRSAIESPHVNPFLSEIKPSDSVSHTASPVSQRIHAVNRATSMTGSDGGFSVADSFTVKMKTKDKIYLLHYDDGMDSLIESISVRAGCAPDTLVLSYIDEEGDSISLRDKTDLQKHIEKARVHGEDRVSITVASKQNPHLFGYSYILPGTMMVAATAFVLYALQRRR